MTKRLTCLLLSLIMIFQLGITAFAGSYSKEVKTAGEITIYRGGTKIGSTGKKAVIYAESDALPKLDYLAKLDMQNVRDTFSDYYNNWKEIVEYSESRLETLNKNLDNMKVTGSFTIEITYPKTMTVPTAFLTGGSMEGFDENVKRVFANDIRTLTEGESENTLTVTVSLAGVESEGTRPGYVLVKELKDNLETYLCDFTLKCEGVQIPDYGTYTVKGKMTGFTLAEGNSTDVTVNYVTEPQTVDAVCTVSKEPGGGGGGGSNGGGGTVSYTVTFDVDGDKTVVEPVKLLKNSTLKASELKVPHKDGYSFNGWYKDAALTEKVTEDIKVTENITLYGTWNKAKSAGKLNDKDHFAYVVGYPDGTVKPTNSVTREEIATIFYRLLLDNERSKMLSKSNSFTDVSSDRWSNTAVSTMENGGVIKGYTDGSFGPAKSITRAEFATIASRLDDMSENVSHGFTDISGHWAEKYIADAVAKGWIAGYEDGTFRPEQNITRAEAMTIINRMLNRFVNEAGIHKDAVVWPDNAKTAWYYYAIEEATNSHDYERQSDGIYETWTAMIPNKDWSASEK